MPEDFQQILPTLRKKGFIQNKDIREVLGISRLRAFRLLKSWVDLGLLEIEGKGRGARYVLRRNAST